MEIKTFINFIFNFLFKPRTQKEEKQTLENFFQIKIKKIKEGKKSDLDDFAERRYYKKLHIQIKNLLDIQSFKGYKILEMGAGSGLLSLHMAREGAEATLLDCSKNALAYSYMLYQELKRRGEFLGKVKFVHQNFFSESFLLDKKFDIVHNSGVIEHYNSEKSLRIVKKMEGLAKTNGYVIVAVPNYFCPDLIFTWIKYRKGTERFYSKKKLKKNIKKLFSFSCKNRNFYFRLSRMDALLFC